MAKATQKDPYPTYTDGNCRDVAGRIVPCGESSVVSPAKTASAQDEDVEPQAEEGD